MSQSVWPKRLLIAGAIVLGLSIAILSLSMPSWMDENDPNERHLLKLEGGESESVNLSKENSYLLFRLDDSPHNCTIIEDATETEVTIGSPMEVLGVPPDREGVDGKRYFAVGSFIPDEDGAHVIHNDAEEGDTLWVIDEMDLSSSTTTVVVGCLGAIFGGCLLPIAFGLWMSGRKNPQNAGLVMQTPDGVVQQRVPTTDDIWRSVHGGEVLDLTVQQQPPEDEIPAPFADRPDRVGELAKVVDEIETIDESVPRSSEEDGGATEGSWKSWDEG